MGHRNSAATPKRSMVTSAGARGVFIARRVATDQPDQISATARPHNTPPLFSAGVNDGGGWGDGREPRSRRSHLPPPGRFRGGGGRTERSRMDRGSHGHRGGQVGPYARRG